MFTKKQTKKDWEWYGNNDPYYGVSALEDFKKEKLSDESKCEFFRRGDTYFKSVKEVIENQFNEKFQPLSSLDFGCGVGRISIPVSRFSDNVTGVDVSKSMIQLARNNCSDFNVKNSRFLTTDEFLLDDETYDFVHSYIVFQHIPVKEGYSLTRHILSKVRPNGICVLHYTFPNTSASLKSKVLMSIYKYVPFAYTLRNKFSDRPVMQMNSYSLPKLLLQFKSIKSTNFLIKLTDHGVPGALIIFRQGN